MSRVHMGLKNGRMGMWVSPSGVDASGEGGRMTLNSDLSHLQIHASGQVSQTGTDDGSGLGRYNYSEYTISFTALPYIPLTFVSNSPVGDRSIIYPCYLSTGFIFETGGFSTSDGQSYRVNTNKIVLPSRVVFTSTDLISYIVFKNKVS